MSVSVLVGDALATLRTLPDQSARCCVTSPPQGCRASTTLYLTVAEAVR